MDKITNLSQTAELMSSRDYKELFIAEYVQLAIRTQRLDRVIWSIEDDTCPKCFEPTCDIAILKSQWKSMNAYLATLIVRAAIEDIDLPEVDV